MRYRVRFADGSVGTRYFDEPLKVGQQIRGSGDSSFVVTTIERQPEFGSIGGARAVPSAALRLAA